MILNIVCKKPGGIHPRAFLSHHLSKQPICARLSIQIAVRVHEYEERRVVADRFVESAQVFGHIIYVAIVFGKRS